MPRVLIKASLLEAAANRIERYGWHQGQYFADYDRVWWANTPVEIGHEIRQDNPPCCILGALYAEVETTEQAMKYTRFVQEFTGMTQLVQYNDAKGRTKEEVVAVLRKAAAEARRGEPVVYED